MSRKYENKIYDQLKNYRRIAEEVKKIIKKIDPEAKIYVFGSVVRGKFTGASDIDILVITYKIDKKYDIMVNVYREIDAPIELHIVTQEMYERWYKKFINEKELVNI
ncbi:DNA polymerase, beta domain protein region [Staphylothermus marinus F1]|uniref:DNA polymerase, beta domain protein region n=1 Tax=Staphylothermus marinus (strain ATCC 43588 / DSM 3639 / JCM 9404 / F1) TaxID=399550 RepID=A3DMB8_STAMF|nr:nucleotidyltransferase domain-containing protein [Staphylothermus marinus]ABN69778.1 DNA polymerase, beta domain protein region [Staphylothermus marinus F1]